jgi:hypothetical protein
MFAELSSFGVQNRSKRSPLLADFLRFNAKQSKHYDVGNAGEKLALAMFEDAGFLARKPKYHGTDLEIRDPKTGEFFEVEIKTATRSESRKSWQFCLNKPKHASLSNSAYVLLILIAEKTVFTYLIPSGFFNKTKQFTISSHPETYKGKAARFRNRGSLNFDAANEIYQLGLLQ